MAADQRGLPPDARRDDAASAHDILHGIPFGGLTRALGNGGLGNGAFSPPGAGAFSPPGPSLHASYPGRRDMLGSGLHPAFGTGMHAGSLGSATRLAAGVPGGERGTLADRAMLAGSLAGLGGGLPPGGMGPPPLGGLPGLPAFGSLGGLRNGGALAGRQGGGALGGLANAGGVGVIGSGGMQNGLSNRRTNNGHFSNHANALHSPMNTHLPNGGAPTAAATPSGASGNAGHKKVFVGGLSWETSEQSLRQYFGRYGTVSDCVIMRDRHTGHPRGFGFVTYDDEAVADRVASARHELDGRQVEAKRAVPRSECVPAARVHARATKKVFVGGLPATCGQQEFVDYFQRFGDIADAQVMYDHQTGNSRGFGFVTFTSEATVERVVDHDDHDIMGKFVDVKRAEPRQVLDARRGREGTPAAASQPSAIPAPARAHYAQQAASAPAAPGGFGAFARAGPAAWAPFGKLDARERTTGVKDEIAREGIFRVGGAPGAREHAHFGGLYGRSAPRGDSLALFAREEAAEGAHARAERRQLPYASRERLERTFR